MKNLYRFGSLALVVIMAAGLIISNHKNKGSVSGANLTNISIGYQASPPMALLMIAKDKEFFEQQGLNVELREFTAGKLALQAFLAGSLDYSVSGDVPPALAALQGNKFIVPAQIVKKTTKEVRVVARKDGDLNNAHDYFTTKKRKLGTSIGGGPEFFTYQFLNKIGVSKDQVEIIGLNTSDMAAALGKGSVDAVAVFDPFAYFAEKELAGQAITFTDPDIYSELYVLEAKTEDIQNPAVLEKILKGLLLAEDFLKNNPEESKQIALKYTHLDKDALEASWEKAEFEVSLTPQLLEFWSQQAAWAKATGKIPTDAPPTNFRSIIFDSVLKKLSPGAVSQ